MINIGIVSNCEISGTGYLTVDLKKILNKEGRNVFILARNKQEDNLDFESLKNVQNYPTKDIPADIIKFWIEQNNITVCLFMGYDSFKETEVIKQLRIIDGLKKISIPVFDQISREVLDDLRYNFFDQIVVTNRECCIFFSNYRQVNYLEVGFDSEIFYPINDNTINIRENSFQVVGKSDKKESSQQVKKIFCPLTPNDFVMKKLVLDAFLYRKRIKVNKNGNLEPECLIHIHTLLQKNKDPIHYNIGNIIISEKIFSRKEMAGMYQTADLCIVKPRSNFDSNFVEATGCGAKTLVPFFGGECSNKKSLSQRIDHALKSGKSWDLLRLINSWDFRKQEWLEAILKKD